MHDTHAILLREIKTFLERSGMAPSYFGKRAAGVSELVARLEAGRTITLRTAERIRAFIADYSRAARKQARDRVE